MTPSHPGDFIRTEVIDELGLNVTQAAGILGVRRATAFFGVSMDMLLRMQAWHDASRMRTRSNEIAVERYQPARP